jgi:hypothetical protein
MLGAPGLIAHLSKRASDPYHPGVLDEANQLQQPLIGPDALTRSARISSSLGTNQTKIEPP